MNFTETTIMIEFDIKEESFDVDLVTKIIGIRPTYCHYIGDKLKYKYAESPAWTIHTNEVKTLDLEKEINIILEMLKPIKDNLIKLKTDYHLKMGFCIVIHIVNGDSPAIYLSPEFIKFAATIGADVDFDVYLE
jgi:hypothetical protein